MSSPKDKLHIAARTYRLRYVAEEDRILLSADLSAETELALPLTRRITRKLVAALAKYMSERSRVAQDTHPLLRDTVLEFEHSSSVAKALAEGKMRTERPTKPITVANKTVHKVRMAAKTNGGLAITFDTSEEAITLHVAPHRIHMVISMFLRMAERAGWDFPPIASWLDTSESAGETADRVVN